MRSAPDERAMHRERALAMLLSPLLLLGLVRGAAPAPRPLVLPCGEEALGRYGDLVRCGGRERLTGGEARVLGLPLDLNRATEAELDALPGIGPHLAERIVRTREAQGPFRSLDDLGGVPGIGIGKLNLLRGRVAVGGSKVTP